MCVYNSEFGFLFTQVHMISDLLLFIFYIVHFFCSCLEVCFMHHDCVYSTTSVHIISGMCTRTNMNHSKKIWLSHFENFDWMLVFKAHHWLCCVESHQNSASSKILILTTLSGYQIWFVSCAIEQNSKTTIIVLYWLCLKLELQWLSSPLKEGVTHLY